MTVLAHYTQEKAGASPRWSWTKTGRPLVKTLRDIHISKVKPEQGKNVTVPVSTVWILFLNFFLKHLKRYIYFVYFKK